MVGLDVIFLTVVFSVLICFIIIFLCLRCMKYVDKEDEERKKRSAPQTSV